MSSIIRVVAALCAVALAAVPLHAQEALSTSGVFGRFADRVVKLEVFEHGSTAKSSMGSGFYVSDAGHIVTNYHVIASLVHEPERYRADVVRADGRVTGLTILGVDVVHDLAVVKSEAQPGDHFSIGPAVPRQGERLYSLGHPRDLGLSIVEGTYNGLLRHTLLPRIHFTAPINPGMSGGPALDAQGHVVGVNVATAGNAVSFLVPIERAAALLAVVSAADYAPTSDLLREVGRQVAEYQDEYLRGLFDTESPTVEMGAFRLPTEPAAFFRCWSSAERGRESRFETVHHHCSTDDYIYIAGDQRTGIVGVSHEHILGRSLNRFQFSSFYGSRFAADNTPGGTEEHVTRWECTTKNVRTGDTPVRAVLCLRRYQKIGELYDAVLKAAVLGRPTEGVVSTLTLSGVSFENVQAVSRAYLERISWR